MKDIKVGDMIEVKISKITHCIDGTLAVEVKNELFENTVEFIVRKDKLVWKSESGRITLK